jgi:hypothetical protein
MPPSTSVGENPVAGIVGHLDHFDLDRIGLVGLRVGGETYRNQRIDMSNPMNELWRAQQEAAARMTQSWGSLLQPAADRTVTTPAPSEVDDAPPELDDARPEDTDTDPDTDEQIAEPEAEPEPEPEPEAEPEPEPAVLNAIQAIQALGEGQREFAEHMTGWAQQQRDVADALTAWASRQRDYADALDRVLASFPTGAAKRPR